MTCGTDSNLEDTVGNAAGGSVDIMAQEDSIPREAGERHSGQCTDRDNGAGGDSNADPTLKLIQEQNQILVAKDRLLHDGKTDTPAAISSSTSLPHDSAQLSGKPTDAIGWSKRLWNGLKRTAPATTANMHQSVGIDDAGPECHADDMTAVPLDDDTVEVDTQPGDAAREAVPTQRIERLQSVDLFPKPPVVRTGLYHSNKVAMVSSAFKTQYIVKQSAPFTKEALCHLAMKKKWIDNNGSVLPFTAQADQQAIKINKSAKDIRKGVSSLVARLKSQKASKGQRSSEEKESTQPSQLLTSHSVATTHLHRPASDYNTPSTSDSALMGPGSSTTEAEDSTTIPPSNFPPPVATDTSPSTSVIEGTQTWTEGQSQEAPESTQPNPIHRVCFEPPANVRASMAATGDLGICLMGLTINKVPNWATESGLRQGDTILKVCGMWMDVGSLAAQFGCTGMSVES